MDQTISDEEILRQFSNEAEKEKAFTLLVHRDQKRIYYFIRRMVIDHDDANDLTQDVFIKVWNHLSSFKGESAIIHWIYKIAVNHTYTFLEKKKKKFTWSSLDDENELVNKLHAGKYIDGDAIQMKLQEGILTLPPKQRIVFQLRYFDEIAYEEMSKMLGTSTGALKASYHKAAEKIEAFMIRNQ
ncbi:MAG TPA: sigma-70 family RNA polymerase sigma factor [Chitinophagales bacterium]|nr:sigma-70 family RNA polymerase sigma factor [Chitinophagales bacterium]